MCISLSRRFAFLRGACEQARDRADGEPGTFEINETALAAEKTAR